MLEFNGFPWYELQQDMGSRCWGLSPVLSPNACSLNMLTGHFNAFLKLHTIKQIHHLPCLNRLNTPTSGNDATKTPVPQLLSRVLQFPFTLPPPHSWPLLEHYHLGWWCNSGSQPRVQISIYQAPTHPEILRAWASGFLQRSQGILRHGAREASLGCSSTRAKSVASVRDRVKYWHHHSLAAWPEWLTRALWLSSLPLHQKG